MSLVSFDDLPRIAPGAARIAKTPSCGVQLRRMALLEDLNDPDLERVFSQLKPRFITAGSVLTTERDLRERVFFAWSGLYRITHLSPAGAHVTMRTIGPGAHFGEIASFAERREYNLVADHSGVLLEMRASAFMDMVSETPALCQATLRALAREAASRGNRLYEFAVLDVKLRLQSELLRLGERGRRIGDIVVINPAPTHDSIATQIGTTREGVTRHMKILTQKGWINARRGEIVILAPQRLHASVEEMSGRRISHMDHHC